MVRKIAHLFCKNATLGRVHNFGPQKDERVFFIRRWIDLTPNLTQEKQQQKHTTKFKDHENSCKFSHFGMVSEDL